MSTPRERSAPPSLSGSAIVVSNATTPSRPEGTSIIAMRRDYLSVMQILDERVERYLHELRPARSAVMAEMEQVAERDSVPIVRWETGRLLAAICRAFDPRVLEVGTAIGYSTLHMAEQLTNGRVITLELDADRARQARGFLERAGVAELAEPKLSERAVLVVDNMLMSGEVALPADAETWWRGESLESARRLNAELLTSGRWLACVLPIGDGVAFAARR